MGYRKGRIIMMSKEKSCQDICRTCVDCGTVSCNTPEEKYPPFCLTAAMEETIEYAKRMGFKKLGIATCVGLIRESRMLARILRAHGFEVYSVACKVGAIDKTKVGISSECEAVGAHICNPIYQAKKLAEEGCELNIMMGLCVGHDSLFYKYSEVLTTTLVVKDRVTGHNPVAPLYTAEMYYKSKLFPQE